MGALTVAGYDSEGYLRLPDGTYDDRYAAWIGDVAGRSKGSTVLVATSGDDLLGTVTWCPYGSAYAQLATAPHQGEFRTLSVSPRARGRGVGGALVGECVGRARAAGLAEIVICSLPEMLPAHRLYTSFGFGRRPELDWSPEPRVDLWAFSLTLR